MFSSLRCSERHSQNSRSSLSQTRGQVGIGTLILFTAVLLIAATTAGVFLQTTGVLEAQSGSTSESIAQQSMSRLATIAELGVVEPVSGSDAITEIRLILKLGTV